MDAALTLEHIERVRQRARSELRDFWFPPLLFGVLTMVSLPLCRVGDGLGPALFWAVAGPVGGAAVAAHYRRRELALGATRAAWPYLVTAAAMMAGGFLLPMVTPAGARPVASAFAIAGGYAVFARLERSWTLAGVAVTMAGAASVAIASGYEYAYVVAWGLIGTTLIVTGLVLRSRQAG